MTDAINHVATIFLISCVSRPRWASTSSIACRYSVSGVVELQCGARRKRDACRAGTGTFSGTNRGPWVRPPPERRSGGNVRDFGSPALDFQVSYERYWAPGLSATTWWVGFAFKTG